MKHAHERVQQVVDKLKAAFPQKDYERENPWTWNIHAPETKDNYLLSVIIPARNEFPNIIHTVHSILNCWEADGFDWKDIEIIVVNNCSTERDDGSKFFTHPVDNGTTSYLEARGIFNSRVVKTLYYPLAGNHTARNRGAETATGKYLFFSDAHMSYRPGFFKYTIKACEESGGIVHGAIAWMGTYPPFHPSIGMQYTFKLGEEFKGTWGPYVLAKDRWFYIPAQGHCSVMVSRKQFYEFGGYQEHHRTYGGGEIYMNMKWWMFGSTVVVEPRAIGYHLKSFRGYNWHHDDYIHNVLAITYALSADDWRERSYLNWLRTGRPAILEELDRASKKEMERDREFIASRRIKTVNELLLERPWNKRNQEEVDAKINHPALLIYHPSWIELLKLAHPNVKEAYNNSKYQKDLDIFIRENLWDFVYKHDNYDKTKNYGTI